MSKRVMKSMEAPCNAAAMLRFFVLIFLTIRSSALAEIHYVDLNSTNAPRLTPTGPGPPRTSRMP
jgi:hypothetical protein